MELQATTDPEVDELRDHCRKVIDAMRARRRELAMAKTKLDEMVYWLRLAKERADM